MPVGIWELYKSRINYRRDGKKVQFCIFFPFRKNAISPFPDGVSYNEQPFVVKIYGGWRKAHSRGSRPVISNKTQVKGQSSL